MSEFTQLMMRLQGFKRAYVKRVGRRLVVRMFDRTDTFEFLVERIDRGDFSEMRAKEAGL